MFSKTKAIFTTLAIICALTIGVGSAYFYFGGSEKEEHSIENNVSGVEEENVKADNIKENYEFGNTTKLNEDYTYYFFPSTLYMEFLNKGLNPEKVFGYNEVSLDDLGNPEMDEKNQPVYEIVKDGTTGIGTDKTYYSYLKNVLNKSQDYYFSSENRNYEAGTYPKIADIAQTGLGENGDDNHYYGYDTASINSVYTLNNENAYEALRDNLNINSNNYVRDESKDTHHDTWTDLYYGFNTSNYKFSSEDEILSPVYGREDSKFNINLDVYSNENYLDAYFLFANFYQTGWRKISNASLSGTIEIDWRLDVSADSSNLSLFVSDSNGNESSIPYNSKKKYLGCWYLSNNQRVVFYDNGAGIFYHWSGDVYHFSYGATKNENGTIALTLSGDDVSGTLTFNDGLSFDQTMKRVQYRNDRFGFWTSFYDWDDPNNSSKYYEGAASRYLPIKITVNGNLTPDSMSKVIPSVFASTYDNNSWFDFTSNVWTYATSSPVQEYDEAIEGFTAKDISSIFDIMQNPEKYADGNNVIRLFPVFSNGKTKVYDSTKGGSDAFRANFSFGSNTSTSIKNDMLATQTKLTYSNISYKPTFDPDPDSGTILDYDLNYAILKNVELRKNRYSKIEFYCALTNGPNEWKDNWGVIYTFSGDALNSFIETYGEGLYTFYLIVGNRSSEPPGGNKLDKSSTVFPTIGGQDILSYVTSTGTSESNDLKNKHLMYFKPNGSTIDTTAGSTYGVYAKDGNNDVGQYSRPVSLLVEKITNLRLVSNIPIQEGENGSSEVEQDWNAIDQSVKDGLLNAKNFLLADDLYYLSETEYNDQNLTSDKITNNTNKTDLTTENPYIYMIKNADFRYVNDLYFQIRFSNDYIKDKLNVEVTFDDSNPQYIAYVQSDGSIIKFAEQSNLIEAGEQPFIQNVKAGDPNGTQRNGFKLRDYTCRGVYDILLVSQGSGDNGVQSYRMYINRHTNSFIKLFNGNPGTFDLEISGQKYSFVRHKLKGEVNNGESNDELRADTSTLLWNGQSYLGDYLSSNTNGNRYVKVDQDRREKPSGQQTFFNAIKNACRIVPGSSNIYPIVDAVTGKAIAYYYQGLGRLFTADGSTNGDSNENLELFTIMKNYVLYIDKPLTN